MVDALDPRSADPCNETRAVSAVRATTLRPERFVVARVAAVVAVRATTLRDGAAVVVSTALTRLAARADTLRDATPREEAVVAVVPRDTVVF